VCGPSSNRCVPALSAASARGEPDVEGSLLESGARQQDGRGRPRQPRPRPRAIDPHRPTPIDTRATPGTGAWENGVPESEGLRQGEFRSPYTGKVYDRWAPNGLQQQKTDRQGGLGRARAYETPQQRLLREAMQEQNRRTPEHEKFYPGLAPPEFAPRTKREPRARFRHARRAGNYADIFKQLVVRVLCDLKVSKSEKPCWYVEPLGGEGEYHIGRLKLPDEERPALHWPTVEDLYEALLQHEDTTQLPQDVQSWLEVMNFLNNPEDQDFETTGDEMPSDDEGSGSTTWLPSTLLVAALGLRKQDPVTMWEDNPIAFAALFNFVRNFNDRLQAHIELIHRDGWKGMKHMFIDKKADSQAHGPLAGRRGLVVIDPDYTRGSEVHMCQAAIKELSKHWTAATVAVTYPISHDHQFKATRFINDVRKANEKLSLLKLEWYIDTPDGQPSDSQAPWRGVGVLVSNPPFQLEERVRDALEAVGEVLCSSPDTHMRIEIEEPQLRRPKGRRRQ